MYVNIGLGLSFGLIQHSTHKFGMEYKISNPLFDILGAECRSRACRTNNLR